MFYIKTKIKYIIGITLVFIGIVIFVLIKCNVIFQKYPTFDEIKQLYYNNEKNFNIANDYLLNQKSNELGIIYYDLDIVKKNKANMTEEEYKAMTDIFSISLIENYYRDIDGKYNYNQNGKFTLKSNYKDVTISICYISDDQEKRSCKHISGNWYAYYYYPHNE